MAGWLYNVLLRLGLESFANWLFLSAGRAKRALNGTNSRIIERYFAQTDSKMLHLGCGENIKNGWLNTDYNPRSDEVLHLDATRSFPFPDCAFDFVYSEHMIEHISFPDGSRMIDECFRVLKPGGIARIATPDLSFLIELYQSEKTQLQLDYIKWSTDLFIDHAVGYLDTFVINNYVRDWDHTFIYDEKTLSLLFERSGFDDIRRCKLRESAHSTLARLENADRLPTGFLEMETVVIEGMKPRGSN